jgi:MFS family permease
MGDGLLHPAIVVWTGDGAPPHLRGVVMGGLATAGDLGSAIGPLVAYALLEIAGLRAAYALCAALMLSALVPLAIVRPAPTLRTG